NIGCLAAPSQSGQIINGSLTGDECKPMTESDRFADGYTFSGQAGQRIDISIIEANFDTFLILYSPTGNPIASDDDSGVGNLARLSFTLPTTGTYTFEVTSSSTLVTGNYVVKLVIGEDYALSFSPSSLTIKRGETGTSILNINRINGFSDAVTITPPNTKPLKIKLTPSTPQSTTSTNLSFTYKTKKTSPLGTQQLSFTGVDSSGKTRTAIINLIIQ
ncbi:MAG: PPC domain-containing protein, partial [Acidobacteria bacterium]|nr:PPC domain-containing protein [Acidobacteriota bacterium]